MTNYQIGDLIDYRYKVLNILGGPGKSGQGIVYVVTDESDNSIIIALKTIQEQHLEDEDWKKTLKREALAWVQLGQHPYIVRALFAKIIDDLPYIGMEYIAPDYQGRNTLTDYLKEVISLEQAVTWALQMCHGMEYSASKGISPHRDIKPANIMVTIDGNLKITDFTMVKFVDEQQEIQKWKKMCEEKEATELTYLRFNKGDISGGTVPWMAAEQFDGMSCIESDIYSFGIVLYQMVNNGKMPFDYKFPAEYYYAHKMKTPPPLNSKLYPIVAKCLEKKPENRFRNFAELRNELETFYKKEIGKKIPALPESYELNAEDHNNRGVAFDALGFPDRAIEELEKALVINPAYTNAQVNLSNLYLEKGDLDKAERILKEALTTNINSFKVYYTLGKIYEQKENYNDALIQYHGVLRLRPYYLKAHYNIAKLNEILENYKEAIAYYDNYLNFLESSDAQAKEISQKIKSLKKLSKKKK